MVDCTNITNAVKKTTPPMRSIQSFFFSFDEEGKKFLHEIKGNDDIINPYSKAFVENYERIVSCCGCFENVTPKSLDAVRNMGSDELIRVY